MDYLSHFGLQAEPFSNAPVGRFYCQTHQHEEAMVRLTHAVARMKGLVVLSGDIGAGKTTLARRLLNHLSEEEYEAALLVIIHSGITARWLLRRIALQLGVADPAEEKLALLGQLYRRLIGLYERGKKAVVLIDEAQMLDTREIMEEFRGLLNLEVPERKLLSFVFFGLPEIDEHLALDPPLAQRVALRIRLRPLEEGEARAYVDHRMEVAGGSGAVFEDAAVERIFQVARGVPRVINTVCDNSLFEAFVARAETINVELVDKVARDLALVPEVEEAPARAVAPATEVRFDEIDRLLDSLGKIV